MQDNGKDVNRKVNIDTKIEDEKNAGKLSEWVLKRKEYINKAQVSKESAVELFFDIEKVFDMMWKEGLLMKSYKMGVGGKMFN